MSYNGSGTFVINTSGQPVVTGTVISSTAFNALTADLGTGLSTAITKDGQTITTAKIPFAQGMSAAVASNFAAGTVAAPSIYLSTDTGTGLYRIGANNDGFAISGAKVLDIASTGLGVTGTLQVSTGAAVGGATPGAGGVAFPASAVAVANANTLDDYEEGSWTPSLGGNTTYNAQTGIYVRIGQFVYFTGYLNVATIGTGNTTTLFGLPFTAINTSNMYHTGGVNYFANLASSITYITLEINVNTTNMSIYSLAAAAASIGSTAIFGDGATLYFSGMYIAA